MIALALSHFSPAVGSFLTFLSNNFDEEGSKSKKATKLPELKIVPDLVHEASENVAMPRTLTMHDISQVEAFDVAVIQVCNMLGGQKKGSVGLQLLRQMRRTVARDFTLKPGKLEAAWKEHEDEEGNM